MELDKQYYEEKERLNEFILNFKEEDCIFNFSEYINQDITNKGNIESKFIEQLNLNFNILLMQLTVEVLGVSGIDKLDFFEFTDDWSWKFSDEEVYPYIKKYMLDTFDDIISDLEFIVLKCKFNDTLEKVENCMRLLDEINDLTEKSHEQDKLIQKLINEI